MFNFIKNISPVEIVLLAVILILIFGTKFVTGIGKTGGETLKEIKNIKKEIVDAVKDDGSESQKS